MVASGADGQKELDVALALCQGMRATPVFQVSIPGQVVFVFGCVHMYLPKPGTLHAFPPLASSVLPLLPLQSLHYHMTAKPSASKAVNAHSSSAVGPGFESRAGGFYFRLRTNVCAKTWYPSCIPTPCLLRPTTPSTL